MSQNFSSEFQTTFQVDKKITTQQSLDMINDAADKGIIEIKDDPRGLSSSGVYKPAANAPQGARVTLPKPQPAGSTAAPAKEATEKDVSAALKVANQPGPNPGLEMFKKYQAKNAVKPMVDMTK